MLPSRMIINTSLFRPYRVFTFMYLINDNMKTSGSERTHIIVGYSKQIEGSILPSPTFLIPSPAPPSNPIVPRVPRELTRLSTAFTPVVPRSTKNFSKSDKGC